MLGRSDPEMNTRFIYDEKTSSLYSPNGTFLKIVSCSKAKNWNQLIVEDGEKRWRKCEDCNENVIDLDALETDQAIKLVKSRWSSTCIHASRNSENVIFLKDINAIPDKEEFETDAEKRVVIKTVRSIEDINRASSMGYAVDIRQVFYETEQLHSIMSIGQDPQSGRIETSGDLRYSFRTSNTSVRGKSRYKEILPFFSHYPYFQPIPIAAYVIPKFISDGTAVLIEDPIEDFVGTTHHGKFRAMDVIGHIEDMKVVIDESDIVVRDLIG